MLSGILIFNQKGENLIFRAFRNDCRPRLADVFRIQVISNAQVRSPILTLGSTTFSHVKHENIYLVAITKSNANAALVFEFLYRFIALGKGYFAKFDEEAVKNNFVLVYELLDGKFTCDIFSTSANSYHRNSRFRVSSKYRDGHAEDVYHNRRSQVRAYYGRFLQDHNAGHRRHVMAEI
jgi:AP-2 complex subunit mu-1